MAWVIFHKFMEKQHDGNALNLDTAGDDIRCMLVDSTRAPVQATDEFIVDIDNNEVSGTNYTAGGYDMTNQSIALATGTVTFDADDCVWTQSASGFSNARYAVIYDYNGTPASDRVICYADLGSNVGNVSGDLTIEMSSSGIWTLTTS